MIHGPDDRTLLIIFYTLDAGILNTKRALMVYWVCLLFYYFL